MSFKTKQKIYQRQKRLILFFGIAFLVFVETPNSFSQIENTITKVVIDAGHGGKDPGAIGKNSKEKDIALAVALKTGKYIEDSIPGVHVIYTRRTDEFIELHKRARIANESGGDVFISIHCNSSKVQQPSGSETYVMGLHKSNDNLDVAKSENAAIFFEEDYKQQYEGFDPNADEDYILLSMFQSASIDQSINLSSKVQDFILEIPGRINRGVKQAGFWVLYKTTMPGILVELGFISNPSEEKFLVSEKGQDLLSLAIFRALREFKTEFEDTNKDLKPVQITRIEKVQESPVYYRVQFASYKKEKSPDFKKFRGVRDIKMYEHEGFFKYTAGNEPTLEKAREIKAEIEKKGFADTFIVAFFNEQRISLDEAQRISQNKN